MALGARVLILSWGYIGLTVLAQSTPAQVAGAQYDVVSIKPNKRPQQPGDGFQISPDGTYRSINEPIAGVIRGAAPVPVYEVLGIPEWARTEGYDIIAKPAPGPKPNREQQAQMMRNLLIERMKFAAHIEDQERDGFGLVVARRDGSLGPRLTRTTLDCAGNDAQRCGSTPPRFTAGSFVGVAMRMDQFAGSLRNTAGGLVTNRTGLDGWYDIKLEYAPTRLDPNAPPDDGPQLPTALQEQLGLKLVREKVTVKILVVDHIERPSPD